MSLACLGYRGDSGGGQPPPPTLPPVQHAGAMAVAKRDAPPHSAVQEGGGAEAAALGSGGGEGIQRLWSPPGYGDLLMIPGEGDLGGGKWLASSGPEFGKGKGGV